MAAIKTLSNLQRMKRSVRLRDESLSDEELISIMEEMMNQAIVAQATGNRKMMNRSLEELRQARKAVRTGNTALDSGSKQASVIGRFSNLIDQLEGEQANVKQELAPAGGGILSNLPSAETLISAVMTANPLLGYSTKIVKDIGASVKSKTQADKEAAKRQAKILEDQRDYVLGRKEELETEAQINEDHSNQMIKYDTILERIESELVALRRIWEGDDTQLVQESQDTNNKLGKLVQVEERLIEEQRLQREQAELAAIEESRKGGGASGLADDIGGAGKDNGGFLSGILGGLGGGLMAGLTGIFSFFGQVLKAGGKFLKFAGKASGIGAILIAVYDFVDGFFNASEILGMNDADVTIGDRIIAGLGNMVGGVIKFFDSILDWFGEKLGFGDLFDTETMGEDVAKGLKSVVGKVTDWVFGMFDNIKNFIKNFDIKEVVQGIKNEASRFIDEFVNAVPEMINGAFEEAGKLFDDVSNWLFGDDEDSVKADVTPEAKKARRGFRNQGALSYAGGSSSAGMTDSMNSLENASDKAAASEAMSAVVAGNNNTNNNYNTTQVTPVTTTGNLDDTLRESNKGILSRYGG